MYVCACVRACVRMCVCACVHACVCAFMCMKYIKSITLYVVLKVAHVPLSREHHALQLPSPGSTMLLSPSLESDIHAYMYLLPSPVNTMLILPSPLRDSGSSWSGNDILYSVRVFNLAVRQSR